MTEFYDDDIDANTASILLQSLVEVPGVVHEDLQDYAIISTEFVTEESR